MQERELRGAWVATVVNLDWPSKPALPVEVQKKELINLLDRLKALNFNAIFFQVRPECDAVYKSNFEPWSYWLTGKQGKPPDPFYDPLKFAIDEAHKRGMELHAWLNPFRAVRKIGRYKIAKSHVSKVHPEWILTFGKSKILNPGLPAVRKYIINIVNDLITRYNLDGIHFDDYFYPYPPDEIKNEDYYDFVKYNRGIKNIKNWRRDNINILIGDVYKLIKRKKDFVKFGVSPFGIYKNGIPEGTQGFDAYNRIYSDPVNWLKNKIVDYVAPQLYWAFEGKQDFGKLLNWWGGESNSRHVYAGIGYYKAKKWSDGEIPRQIEFTRGNDFCKGFIMFRANLLNYTFHPVVNKLREDYFYSPVLPPVMNWLQSLPPQTPEFFTIEDSYGFLKTFNWGNFNDHSIVRYVIYQSFQNNSGLTIPYLFSNIVDINNENSKTFRFFKSEKLKSYYTVSSVNNYNYENIYGKLAEAPPVVIYDSVFIPQKINVKELEEFVNNQIRFEISIPKTKYYIIKLFDLYGTEIGELSRDVLKTGYYKFSIAKKDLKNGIYYFVFFSDKDHFVKKIKWLNSD